MMLQQVTDFYQEYPTLTRVLLGLTVATAGIVVYRYLSKRNERKRTREEIPNDTVIVHQIGRGPYAPSMTSFAIKLETYLRMAKIPYKNEHEYKKSSKGKFPWMEYNGQSVADSAFCIAHLNKAFGIDLNAQLTPTQTGVAVAYQRLVEDSLYWAMVVQRWVQEVDLEFAKIAFRIPLVHLIVKLFIIPAMKKSTWCQGIGRHSREEVLEIARKDLTAIADYMGSKQFLMGDEPCETDCTLFGLLAQIHWHCPTQTLGIIFREEFPTLVAYCERMKSKYWPDWDDCITHGGTRPATK